MPLHPQPILLRQLRQILLRPRADVLDDLGRGQGAELGAAQKIAPLRVAGEKTRREKIAGARGVDDFFDRKGRRGQNLRRLSR